MYKGIAPMPRHPDMSDGDTYDPALVAELARLRQALGDLLGAFDPEWPGACGQDCFDTSDGHGYERQEAALRQARAALNSRP